MNEIRNSLCRAPLPPLTPASHALFFRALPRPPRAGHGSQEARRRGSRGSVELRFLRRWREGEDLRLVHWKVSARTGERVLRELEGEEQSVLRSAAST